MKPASVAVGQANCTENRMFVNEFFFSFSLLAFTGLLFLLGTAILIDAFRRLANGWWLQPSRHQDRGVVLVVDVARPITDSIGDGTHDVVQRPLPVPDEKLG